MEKRIIENVEILIASEIKRLKNTESSQFNKGQMDAYSNVLSSMGVNNEDIALFIASV